MVLQGDVYIDLAVSFDQLIYNLLRQETTLTSLRTFLSANSGSLADLEQLMAVQRYFHDQLEAHKVLTGRSSLSVDAILLVIREKMDGLTLRAVDVESYDRFNENPTHAKFFRVLLRTIVASYRESDLLRPNVYL